MTCSATTPANTLRPRPWPMAVVLAALWLAAAWDTGLEAADRHQGSDLQRLFARERVTILVTDSGLGGLAVAAELERELRSLRAFREVTVVFASALPDVSRPYNAMASRREQVETFDRALSGMARWYRPDLILVACNTLSVLLPETRFLQARSVPVVGIVDAGVRALAGRLTADPAAVALVLGTATTVSSGAHRQGLEAAGIDGGRVQEQACPNLEAEIQSDPGSDLVRGLIEAYGDEARRGLAGRSAGRVVVGLCCSHYGYARTAFSEVLAQQFGSRVEIVDPNREMVAALLVHARQRAYPSTRTTVQVVSRALLSKQERVSVAAAVAGVSPKTAAALTSYTHKWDLFEERDPRSGR